MSKLNGLSPFLTGAEELIIKKYEDCDDKKRLTQPTACSNEFQD
jgi:hypothetical protein